MHGLLNLSSMPLAGLLNRHVARLDSLGLISIELICNIYIYIYIYIHIYIYIYIYIYTHIFLLILSISLPACPLL